jgi:hypothetical protein
VTFGKDPLLTEEEEEQLKYELGELWNKGLKGREIAKQLGFGEEGTIYENLKLEHVYFYRIHFGLRRHKKRTMKKNPMMDGMHPRMQKFMFKWRSGMPESVISDLMKDGLLYGYPSSIKDMKKET